MPPSSLPAAEPLHRVPELLGRLPLPAEAWARFEQRLPEPVAAILALRHRLPPMPQLTARRLFAAALPAGLMLGWLVSFAVDPEIMQRGGKPYSEVAIDGVQVQLPKLAFEDTYPVDPAPFGYRDTAGQQAPDPAAAPPAAEADGVEVSAPAAPQISDGQVLGEAPAQQPPRFTATPVIQVVPQDTPLQFQ